MSSYLQIYSAKTFYEKICDLNIEVLENIHAGLWNEVCGSVSVLLKPLNTWMPLLKQH